MEVASLWPYPSYGDRQWLGGERGSDAALAAVVKALRSLVVDGGGRASSDPADLLGALGHLAELSERVDWAMLSIVGEARASGLSWSAIGAALGVTKQAAQQRFAAYVQEALDQASG